MIVYILQDHLLSIIYEFQNDSVKETEDSSSYAGYPKYG